MLFKWRNSNEFHVLLCDAEGLLAACFGVNIMEGLIDCDAAFLTEILDVQVQRLPDVIFMRIVLLSNKVHEDKPDIIFFCFVLENRFCHPCQDSVGNVL
jgi:hypothetical protein